MEYRCTDASRVAHRVLHAGECTAQPSARGKRMRVESAAAAAAAAVESSSDESAEAGEASLLEAELGSMSTNQDTDGGA